jgi:hypothetical protein
LGVVFTVASRRVVVILVVLMSMTMIVAAVKRV